MSTLSIAAIAFIAATVVAILALTYRLKARLLRDARDTISGRQVIRRAAREEAYRQVGGAHVSRKLKRLIARSAARRVTMRNPK